jgi:hypothetical protein
MWLLLNRTETPLSVVCTPSGFLLAIVLYTFKFRLPVFPKIFRFDTQKSCVSLFWRVLWQCTNFSDLKMLFNSEYQSKFHCWYSVVHNGSYFDSGQNNSNAPVEIILVFIDHSYFFGCLSWLYALTLILGVEWGKSLWADKPLCGWKTPLVWFRTDQILKIKWSSTNLMLTYSTQNVYKVVAARKGSMLLALAMVSLNLLSYCDFLFFMWFSDLHFYQLFPFGLLMAGALVWYVC